MEAMKLLVLIVCSMFTCSVCLCKSKLAQQKTTKPVQTNPIDPNVHNTENPNPLNPNPTQSNPNNPKAPKPGNPKPIKPNPVQSKHKFACTGTNGKTYQTGESYKVGCFQYICGIDGDLKVKIDSTCCLHIGNYYEVGHVVEEIMHGKDCVLEHTVCKDNGHVIREPVFGKCNCEYNGDSVREGDNVTLSTGAKASCCNGIIVTPVNKTIMDAGVKLVGGMRPGMGDVYLGDIPVGDCNWNVQAASILCQDLGFGDAIETPKRILKSSDQEALFKNFSIRCHGDESSINHCKIADDCNTGGVASVRCSRVKIDDNMQVFLDGEPLCIHESVEMEARALCRELGFFSGILKASQDEVTSALFKKISCSGPWLSECTTSQCTENSKKALLTCSNKMDIQLFGANGENEGNIYFRGGPVCDDGFDIEDGNIVCQELGFEGAEMVLSKSPFGLVNLPFTLDNVNCHGNETKLAQCQKLGPEESNCEDKEGAGVICARNTHARKKRNAAAVIQAVDTGSKIVGSVMNYFSEKEKQHQAYLNERPDMVDLSKDKLSIKMKPQKGYLDPSGEFNPGGFQLDIGNEGPRKKESKDGGPAFTYGHGIGPMLMNGCFGTNYQAGDPCYAAKRQSTKCLDMIESANFVGVGFDGTGEYTHANRKKSLIQRQCTEKSTYQGEDVPDNMNVFGIYDTACTGKTFTSLDARSEYQRQQSDMGSNEDLLKYKGGSQTTVKGKLGFLGLSGSLSAHYSSYGEKQTQTSSTRRSEGKAEKNAQTSQTMVFEFTCSIRRYNIFLDEVTPSMLSEAFLEDYMNLPIRYYDFRQQAPLKYSRFLQRWGTHYIKSASFGGKFTLLRESRMDASENEVEWQERVQEDTSRMFESKQSSVSANAKYSAGFFSGSAEANVNTQSQQNAHSSSQSSNEENEGHAKKKKATSYSMDDIIVEGGDHKVASILADKHRAGFKAEFQDWLDSIPKYPKGYDFVFGELPELLDMNYRKFLSNDFEPCWKFTPILYDRIDERGDSVCGNYKCLYNTTKKNDDGEEIVEIRKCEFQGPDDYEEKMQRKLLSLKRAIDIFIKNGGKSTTEMTIPGGNSQCENAKKTFSDISYKELIKGETYRVDFDLRDDIGEEIQKADILYISFKHGEYDSGEVKKGRWAVDDSNSNSFAGQYSKRVDVDEASKEVLINGVKFSYESDKSGNYLMMSKEDCEVNKERITSMAHQVCNETKDIYWINVPLATVRPMKIPNTFYPCNLEWSNANMLMSESSCVRFTATSVGPIYFALAAIPNRPDAMYYLRISPTDVTVYKNNALMDTKTTELSAVGLGHRDIFQSYIICSEHGKEEDSNEGFTRITYGKLEADETIKRDATLNAYLIVKDDDSPIEPTFFAFGAGEDKVQIVDLELLDLPIGPNINCRGDTIQRNGQCVQACEISHIAEMSKQTVDVKCYHEDSGEEYSNSTLHVGEGSICMAICPDREVAYPSKTVCKGDSTWSDELKCHKECDKEDPVITKGLLSVNGNKELKALSNLKIECPNQKDFSDLVIKGVKCEVSCGTDASGFKYNSVGSIECSDTSKWMSSSQEVVNLCLSSPCSSITNVPNGKFGCIGAPIKKGGDEYVSEGTSCTLESCDNKYKKAEPSTVTCSNGEWKHGEHTESLQCIPTDQTCPTTIPTVDHGTVSCKDQDKTNDGKYLGGTICKVRCNNGYKPEDDSSSLVQCINGKWDVKVNCVNTCPGDLPKIDYGTVACEERDKTASGTFLHGTACNVKCQWGYKLKDSGSNARCHNGQWSTTAVCVQISCPLNLAKVDYGTVSCKDEDKVDSGSIKIDKTCNVVCNSGYKLKDANTNMLCNYGKWSTKAACKAIYCPSSKPALSGGRFSCEAKDLINPKDVKSGYKSGTRCKAICFTSLSHHLGKRSAFSVQKPRLSLLSNLGNYRCYSNCHLDCNNGVWSTKAKCYKVSSSYGYRPNSFGNQFG